MTRVWPLVIKERRAISHGEALCVIVPACHSMKLCNGMAARIVNKKASIKRRYVHLLGPVGGIHGLS